MKKLFIAAIVIGGAMSITSCKKDYTCCTSVTVLGTTTDDCNPTGKISKADKDEIVEAGEATAAAATAIGIPTTFTCE